MNTILIIDDNRENLHVVVDYLNSLDFVPLTARNGQTGLKRAKIAQPDLILLDIQMPGIDGFEVCRRLKADEATRQIPVIFMTVMENVGDKVKGFGVGGVDYITKPVQIEELMARIKAHLLIRNLRQQLQTHNQQLEERVAERTASLKMEIADRKKYQQEKDKLFEMVHSQSEQLRNLTSLIISSQQTNKQDLMNDLNLHIAQNLIVLQTNLDIAQTLLDYSDDDLKQNRSLLQAHIQKSGQVVQQMQDFLATMTENLAIPSSNLSENLLLKLTTRERELLQLMVDGKSPTEIAELLQISSKTVYSHRSRIMKKLGVNNITDLTHVAVENIRIHEE
ncbi:response regulator transcription factor [Anaerolineales bacterium HSG24]|nr:response regulator transcription factor [Anaerolineales bacterium HSG24]